MKESCCQFGPEGRLAGIITEPGARTAPRLGLVLVSAGLLPKSGPYRLYAELARRLARDGVVSLRFDLGGIGDSVQELGGHPLKARTELEIRAALDYLSERHALHGVVLAGLCSGAEDSLRGAAADPRVTGVVMIDAFAYRTSGWAWRHVVHRIKRRALCALGLYEPIAPPGTADKRPRLVRYKYMERSESTPLLRTLLARNAHIHFVYTAGMRELFNHERQLRASFEGVDFKDLVTLDYFPHLDHTQALEADRQTLVDAIARRLRAAADVEG